jgi:death on curing protein
VSSRAVWLTRLVVDQIHAMQLAAHGGLPGVRDENAIESALARAQRSADYGTPDLSDLAAAYLYGLARNHGFTDGNKRTAWIAARTFLHVNGVSLRATSAEIVALMLGIATDQFDEATAAHWIRTRILPRSVA